MEVKLSHFMAAIGGELGGVYSVAARSGRVTLSRYAVIRLEGRRLRSTAGRLNGRVNQMLKQMVPTASNVQLGGYFARINRAISARASNRCKGSVSQSCQARAILFTTCSATALPRRSARSLRYS